MAMYLISYDLEQPPKPRDYGPIESRMEEIGALRILYSEWLLESDLDSGGVYTAIADALLQQDRLLVLKLTREATWDSLMASDDEVKKLLQRA